MSHNAYAYLDIITWMNIKEAVASLIEGDVQADPKTLQFYSHDASLFEVKPQAVVFPKNSNDIGKLVRYVAEQKDRQPELSLTARSGGTDMSGGAINDSVILDFSRYFKNIGDIESAKVVVQPGVYYRDLEPKTLAKGLLMPSYPASREICMVGGMVANHAGGEKSLTYGKIDRYVESLKIILRDGNEYEIKSLSKKELDKKLEQKDLEGEIYRRVFELIDGNQKALADSKPKVSKNSTGYNLWEVWDGKTFDLTKVIVGSQGTLGLITEVTFKLVPAKPYSAMVVAFMPELKNLGKVINAILPLKPSSLESFDEHTLRFAFRFFFSFRATLGWKRFILLGLSFIPVLRHLLRFLPKLPKLILLCEFEGDNEPEIHQKIGELQKRMDEMEIETQLAKNKHQEEKFWIMRRESFNLLRKNVKQKHTAPFIDDLVVPPKHLPEFLPQLTEILERYELLYTVAGHMGDGNFHIIPLMDLSDRSEREKIPKVFNEVTELVLKYDGSLSGEHNDGMIRGPFLARMYRPEVVKLFNQTKEIFDPQGIFNPHKKTNATWEYSEAHMRNHF